MGDSKLVQDIVKQIEKIAKKLRIEPYQVTKARFLEFSNIDEWSLRKVGGYQTLLATYYPIPNKELKSIQLNDKRKAYIEGLEKKYGSWELFKEGLNESIVENLKNIQVNPLVLDKKETEKYLKSISQPSPSGDTDKRSIVTVWSDQHFGTHVDRSELAGKNEFNWIIGARRLGMLCEQIATYKVERRSIHEELVILLLGDNIGGVIHNQEGPDYDLITHQINGTLSYYIQAIHYLKPLFPKIRVLCQPGNHGRVQHKQSKDRALSQKYDSFENQIFYSLSWQFKNDPQVSIEVPKSPFVDALIQGHRIFATHGDTVFDTGNVGKSVNLAKLEHQIHRINAEELAKGRKEYELFATGHVHHPVLTQVGPGIKVVINGCLIGTDSYALGVGIHSSVPVQVLWECTKKFVQGDTRQIYVDTADNNAKYEKVIKPFNYELSVPKFL